jgi:phenylpyruvate tautomerase PptA (4-oxalocrotonate tautomerase family)
MPICRIDAPPGIRADAKRLMVEKITAAIDEAYHIGETLVFLQEYPPENVAMNGRLQSENPKIQEILRKISS